MLLNKNHYLNLKNGVFDTTSKTDLDNLFTYLATAPHHEKLVVHFHGGLVSAQAGLATAEYLMDYFKDLEAYQVFFVWESGLMDVLSTNLPRIFSEPIFQQLLMRVTQFATAKIKQKDGERGGLLELPDELEVRDELHQPANKQEPFASVNPGELPQNEKLQPIEEDQFRKTLHNDYVVRDETQKIANSLQSASEDTTRGIGTGATTETLMSPSILEDIGKEAPDPETRGPFTTSLIVEGTVAVLGRVINRFVQRRDHGLYATIVEELLRQFYLANVGKIVWDLIKNETVDAFGNDSNRYAGTAFLMGLKAYYENGQRPHITLVGHSAGAVYICHLLKHVDADLPKEITFDVVFLAPACNFTLFSETLANYSHRIANIRVFGMLDTVERADVLVPVLYPYSLLYLASGIMEEDADTPLVGMQRYYTGDAPYDSTEVTTCVKYLLEDHKQRIVWSEVNAGEGLASSAKKHGNFYHDVPTLESLRYIIMKGL